MSTFKSKQKTDKKQKKNRKKSDIIEKVTPNEANQIYDPLFTVKIDPFSKWISHINLISRKCFILFATLSLGND